MLGRKIIAQRAEEKAKGVTVVIVLFKGLI
jgi:hypothetical protein